MSASSGSSPFFSCTLPMRWGDMDAFGHINNTLYLRYCEEARFQLLAEKNIQVTGDSYPVVVTIGCTFLRPVFYPDTLRVDCTLAEPGRSSFMIYYKIYTHSQPDSPAAEAYSKVVWVDARGKSQALPDNVRQWFSEA